MQKPFDVKSLYNLPTDIEFCSRCVMSNQRPRIAFTDGICSACTFAEHKSDTDWSLRENELCELLDRHRSSDGSFDVVVPCSGGKDGSFVANTLKEDYGMHVLAVTWAPLLPTDIGRSNLQSFISSGFDHIMGTPNPEVTRRLCRESFMEIGDPFQPFIYGQTNFPVSVARQHGIGLIFYGENGEVEYGGDMGGAQSPRKLVQSADEHYFSGRPLDFWLERGFSKKDLELFTPAVEGAEPEQHFFGYYKRWDPQENYYYASQHVGFTANPERSEGTFSKYASLDDKLDGFHYFLGFLKFGIGRCTSDAAHEVRDGKISREEAVALVRKYDGEFPGKYFGDFLEFTGLSEPEFWSAADRWRSPHLWYQGSDGTWSRKATVFEA